MICTTFPQEVEYLPIVHPGHRGADFQMRSGYPRLKKFDHRGWAEIHA